MKTALLFLAHTTCCIAQLGQAIVINKCTFPVYQVSVGDTTSDVTSISPGSFYSETFQLRRILNETTQVVNYAGISIMLSSNQSLSLATDMPALFQSSTITQFEYTIDPTIMPGLWYDISNVNGYVRTNADGWNGILPWPFQDYGLVLEGTDSSCPTVKCPGGNPNYNSSCVQAYTHSRDDYASHSCSKNNSLTLTLCTTLADGLGSTSQEQSNQTSSCLH